MMASSEGGVEIEEVAAKHPEKILRARIDPVVGLAGYQARDLAFGLGLSGAAVNSFVKFGTAMYRAYEATDASIVEINPLVLTKQGEVIALDAKINLDDNALYRHKELAALRDPDEEDPREAQAKEHDLSYVGLEGNIGCMVNGAGLAMSTMDMIKLAGGEPANFLDVGGGADEAKVTAAFKLLLADPQVKAVLVNIFGGIMKCDVIASGIIAAARQVHLAVPLVVRLEGTNVEQGKALLAGSGLAIIPADDLGDAARKAVAAANKAAGTGSRRTSPKAAARAAARSSPSRPTRPAPLPVSMPKPMRRSWRRTQRSRRSWSPRAPPNGGGGAQSKRCARHSRPRPAARQSRHARRHLRRASRSPSSSSGARTRANARRPQSTG